MRNTIQHEIDCVKLFLRNNNENSDQWDIETYPEQESPVDVIATNKTDGRIIKIQVRWIDDDLIQKFYGDKVFFGERDYIKVVNIVKEAIEKKKNKYTSIDAEDIVLLLNGVLLWSLLELFKILQKPNGDDTKDLIDKLKNVSTEKFKEIYIVTEIFNICIK